MIVAAGVSVAAPVLVASSASWAIVAAGVSVAAPAVVVAVVSAILMAATPDLGRPGAQKLEDLFLVHEGRCDFTRPVDMATKLVEGVVAEEVYELLELFVLAGPSRIDATLKRLLERVDAIAAVADDASQGDGG